MWDMEYRTVWQPCSSFLAFALLGTLLSLVSSASPHRALNSPTSVGDEARYYSYDGFGNNLQVIELGSINSPRIRNFPPGADYFEGSVGTPRDETNSDLPSARRVMEEVFRKTPPKPDKSSNDMVLQFGAFVVSDIMEKGGNSSEPFPVPCDGSLTDFVYCPVTGQAFNETDPVSIKVLRNAHKIVSNNQQQTYRATIDESTPFLDLSNIYGTSEDDVSNIRSFEGGRLAMDGDDLPVDKTPRKYNSSPGIFSYFVLFMRYHNRLADKYAAEHPALTDEEIFQEARRYNIAVYQSIVSESYLPTILGNTLSVYRGYDPNMDPSIDEFFSSVSFRYAHSSTPHIVRVLDPDFQPTVQDPLFLRDVFRQPSPNDVPSLIGRVGGIEPILRGMTTVAMKATDPSFVDDINLWAEATSVVDIQRARDVGIPPYNQLLRMIDMSPLGDMGELVGDNAEMLDIMNELYSGDIEKVEAYVGVLFEQKKLSMLDLMGPIFTNSIKDQFERIRSGDRLWYQDNFSEEEITEFPTLREIIQSVCPMMDLLPYDLFRVWNGVAESTDDASCQAQSQVSLLGGEMIVGWNLDPPSTTTNPVDVDDRPMIEVTLTAKAEMEGPGFIGIGWGGREMIGAEIWFCTIDRESFRQYPQPFPDSCDVTASQQDLPDMFKCCLVRGERHYLSACSTSDDSIFYPLEVMDWCLTDEKTSVTIRAPLCDNTEDSLTDQDQRYCFSSSSGDGDEIDLIVSFNPSEQTRPHGFQRRTSTRANLRAGILTESEGNVADDGLIAYHAITMLIFWLVLAPVGIFIVRYMKTRSWRLVAHISIMGVVGGLMIPLLLGVEFAVGATDKSQEHAIVGLSITFAILIMFIAGRIRYSKLEGGNVGKRTATVAHTVHKIAGYTILGCAWWNCYTGLVRIGPEDSTLEFVVLSSFPLGYDIPVFGFIRQYIYFPYLGFICLVFLVAEIRKRHQNGFSHFQRLKEVEVGKTMWNDDDTEELEEMTMKTFLELTRMGSLLTIVDGRVVDMSNFIDHHPGGRDMLQMAAGSDITDEFVGLRDVEGYKHTHSHSALQKLKGMVKAVLVDDPPEQILSLIESSGHFSQSFKETDIRKSATKTGDRAQYKRVFRRAKILDVRFLTPGTEISESNKPVVMLRLALPTLIASNTDRLKGAPILPSSCFSFRVTNPWGSTFESYYTPVKLMGTCASRDKVQDNEEVYEFLISLFPGGQIAKSSLGWKIGKSLAVRGPSVNPKIVSRVISSDNRPIVMLASGTGIAPILQLIDYYSDPRRVKSSPRLFLIWVLKNPEHNYSEEIGLQERVQRSRGKFKWVVIYSSSKKTDSLDDTVEKAPVSSRSLSLNKLVKAKGGGLFKPSKRKTIKGTLVNSIRREASASLRTSKLIHRDRQLSGVGEVVDLDFWFRRAGQYVTVQLDQEVVKGLLDSVRSCLSLMESEELVEEEQGPRLEDDAGSTNGEEVDKFELEGAGIEVDYKLYGMTVFICGSPRFDDDMRNWINDAGVPSGQILNFYSSTVHL